MAPFSEAAIQYLCIDFLILITKHLWTFSCAVLFADGMGCPRVRSRLFSWPRRATRKSSSAETQHGIISCAEQERECGRLRTSDDGLHQGIGRCEVEDEAELGALDLQEPSHLGIARGDAGANHGG